MKVTRNFLLVAAATAVLFTAAPAYADLKMGVAAEPYPPFTSKDASGVWIGWEVDFMNALCAEIGEKCSIEEVAWDGIIPALQSKKFDAIMSSMSVKPERELVINFSSLYYNSAAVLIGPKGDDKDITPETSFGQDDRGAGFHNPFILHRQVLCAEGCRCEDLCNTGRSQQRSRCRPS